MYLRCRRSLLVISLLVLAGLSAPALKAAPAEGGPLRKAYLEEAVPRVEAARKEGTLDKAADRVYTLLLDVDSDPKACEEAVVKLGRKCYAATGPGELKLADGTDMSELGAALYLTKGSLAGIIELTYLVGDGGMQRVLDLAKKHKLTVDRDAVATCKVFEAMRDRMNQFTMQTAEGAVPLDDLKSYGTVDPTVAEVVESFAKEPKAYRP